MLRLVFMALLSCVTLTAQAMTFNAEPPLLYLGGAVVASDWDAWEEAMIRFDGQIDTVVLHQSAGGDSGAGRKIGNDIRKRDLKTVVSGRCSSACANMFLAGTSRQFAERIGHSRAVLGFHGSYNKQTKSVNRKRSAEYFVAMSDGKMNEAFVERFIRIENKRGMMRFIHPKQRENAREPAATLCSGIEHPGKFFEQCETLNGVDALSKGVVTTWDTRAIGKTPTPTGDKVTVKSWDVAHTPNSHPTETNHHSKP